MSRQLDSNLPQAHDGGARTNGLSGITFGRPRRVRKSGRWASIILLAPFGLLFVAFFIVPVLYAIRESLVVQHASGLGIVPTAEQSSLSGANYIRAAGDKTFLESILRVLLYGIVQVPVCLALALFLALLLDSGLVRFVRFFRLAIFVPFAVPGVIAVIMWTFLYSPDFSPIVAFAHNVGLESFSFTSKGAILWSIANISVWAQVGFNTIIILAGLQAIPKDLFEAARLDGATEVWIAWHVKIPLSLPAILLTLVFAIIGALQLFGEPLVLQSIAATIPSTYTPNLMVYTSAFSLDEPNYAAALAVVLALICFVLSFGFLRLIGRRSFEVT